MSQRMKIGGEWLPIDLFLKVKGEWKESTGVYVKVNGEWKLGRHIHTFNYVSDGVDTTHTGTCAHCGEEITEGHVYALIGGTAPTCTDGGNEIYLCDKCNQRKTVAVAAKGHNYKAGEYIAATCTDWGVNEQRCEDCGDYFREEIPPLGHSYGTPVHQDATCYDAEGYWHTCTRCGHYWFDHISDALGHDYQASYEDMPDGSILCTWTCTRCGDSYTEK